jgi:hypothetical protein
VVEAIEQVAEIEPKRLTRWPLVFVPVLLPCAALLRFAAAGRGTKKWDKVSLRSRLIRTAGHAWRWLERYGVRQPARAAGWLLRRNLKAGRRGLAVARRRTSQLSSSVTRRFGGG